LALAALALVVFGAYDRYPSKVSCSEYAQRVRRREKNKNIHGRKGGKE